MPSDSWYPQYRLPAVTVSHHTVSDAVFSWKPTLSTTWDRTGIDGSARALTACTSMRWILQCAFSAMVRGVIL